MAKFADLPVVEVATNIEAPPRFVWALVRDINLPAQFQSEFTGAEWLDDGDVQVGSRFVGHNQRGEWNWETTSWVVEYEPERVFSWAVSDRDNPGAIWTFRLEPANGGTSLTYHRQLGPGPSGLTSAIKRNPDNEESIISARDAEHRDNMQAVVDGVKKLAELKG
ncbi:MAG: SRPBCC family protein [Acidimicrobiia bacterium]|nr:SRPBCC family protein [Acidimicrobiia bacterium]